MTSAAQDEFNALSARTDRTHPTAHPDDAHPTSDHSDPGSDIEVTAPSSSDDDDDNDEEKSRFPTKATMPSAVYHIPRTTLFDANTGPKGVIADAKSFDRARKRSFRQTLNHFSHGLGFGEKAKGSTPAAAAAAAAAARSREDSSGSDISGSEEEDEFMRTWRATRMTEMQTTGHDHRTRRLSPSQRRYGQVVTVDPLGYLDAVDRVAATTVVVVMICDDRSPISAAFEHALGQLARKYEFTRFVKMSQEDAEMDPVSVPAVLAYQAGDLFANLVSIIDELPEGGHINASSLEAVLRS
ncbi:hypothetical protein MMC19_005956 [Ptychographa xylographoides]|nr:hypothetical protein [Ptychographa xylographoides]